MMKRVAVLGGGMGALTTALALTELDPEGTQYDITVYQLGWRLGGKGASGRNAAMGQRIEEHGLHVWAGFYENAFTLMRIAYNALNRPANAPLATVLDAFKRQNQTFLTEHYKDAWLPWPFYFKPDPDPSVMPGRDDLFSPCPILPTFEQMIGRMVGFLVYNHRYYEHDWPADHEAQAHDAIALMPDLMRHAIGGLTAVAGIVTHPLLALAMAAAEGLSHADKGVRDTTQHVLQGLLSGYKNLLRRHFADGYPGAEMTEVRRFVILADTFICLVSGCLKYNVLEEGLIALDPIEFSQFLADEDPLDLAASSALAMSAYDYVFAFDQGDVARPALSACSAFQGFSRLVMTYSGALFFKMQAGMGDTVFTPFYQALKDRGVTFKFFHNVVSLEPTEDGTAIGAIIIDEQAALATGVAAYQPLVSVKGLDCWPSTPLWDQLADGQALAADGVNFEHATYGVQPPRAARHRLERGEHFDEVVLGISLAALETVCAPLLDKAGWRDMVTKIGTTRTQAAQLWLTVPLADLDGPYVEPPPEPQTMGPILTSYAQPLDTWSDMSQLLPMEDWPAPEPLNIAYFCGPMGDADAPNDPKLATEAVKTAGAAWFTANLAPLWPAIGTGAAFDYTMLYAPSGGVGPARFDDQYWRANIEPTERYVLSLPDTLKYRKASGDSGFANLVLAGDWTLVPEINAGCIEVAAMSGLAAAAALSGTHIPIVAANTLYPRSHPTRGAGG